MHFYGTRVGTGRRTVCLWGALSRTPAPLSSVAHVSTVIFFKSVRLRHFRNHIAGFPLFVMFQASYIKYCMNVAEARRRQCSVHSFHWVAAG